ncbi:hypothetical protein ACHAWF_011513 [Thalassiosira exigua]
MIARSWIFLYMAIAQRGLASWSFSTRVAKAIIPGATTSDPRGGAQFFVLHATTDDDEEGGTAWIKNSMGSNGGSNEGSDGGLPPTNSNSDTPEFSQDELNEMEQLVVSLSRESDDAKRRERLAEILDRELVDEQRVSEGQTVDLKVPRFAQLFQLSLDIVGERVQAKAREAALEQQAVENLNGGGAAGIENEGDGIIQRLKSPEELRLWALIDMMVQSKTRVKLHMGSLGSKGEFR